MHTFNLVKTDGFTIILAGDLTYNLSTLRQEIPDVVLLNKAAKQTVKAMHTYVKNNPSVYLSSHDWNAPEILAGSKLLT